MSPIDDELRAALHGRAQSLAPAPDPLAGIERRARRIQRTRIGAAVAGSALAVAAIAVVVPALQSTTTTPGPRPPTLASAEPTPVPAPASYALDPTDPWALRGDPVDEGTRATIQREYATRVQGAEVLVTPLFAQVYEPSAQLEVVFLAEVDGAYRWGVAQASESGPEFLWDQALAPETVSLAAALPGDEVARLLVVASPESLSAFYSPNADSEFFETAELAPGVFTLALDGDPDSDRYRLELPDQELIADAPQPQAQGTPEDEGPGTDTPVQVDTAAYGFDPTDPWDYRGPAELTTAPNLASDDERLFVQTDPSRDDGSWSQRPLYAGDADGSSFLMILHTEGDQAIVTTTWQVPDGGVLQTEQPVRTGQLLIQSVLTRTSASGGTLLALASPQAGGLVLETPTAIGSESSEPSVGLWQLDDGDRSAYEILVYTEGDGLLYHSEPVRLG